MCVCVCVCVCMRVLLYLSRTDAHIELHPTCVIGQRFVVEVTWLTRRILRTRIHSHARWSQRRDHGVQKTTHAANHSTRKRIKSSLGIKDIRIETNAHIFCKYRK